MVTIDERNKEARKQQQLRHNQAIVEAMTDEELREIRRMIIDEQYKRLKEVIIK